MDKFFDNLGDCWEKHPVLTVLGGILVVNAAVRIVEVVANAASPSIVINPPAVVHNSTGEGA